MTVTEPVDDRRRPAAPGHIAVQIAWLERQPGGRKGLAAGARVTDKTLRNWKNGVVVPRKRELEAVHTYAMANVAGYPHEAGVPSLVDLADDAQTDRASRRLWAAVACTVVVMALAAWAVLARAAETTPNSAPPPGPAPTVVPETANDDNGSGTFRDHVNGVDPGPRIDPGATVEVSCRAEGLPVGNGNPWWYRVSSEPWDDDWWTPTDNIYNNPATSGPLADTPFVDESVPFC